MKIKKSLFCFLALNSLFFTAMSSESDLNHMSKIVAGASKAVSLYTNELEDYEIDEYGVPVELQDQSTNEGDRQSKAVDSHQLNYQDLFKLHEPKISDIFNAQTSSEQIKQRDQNMMRNDIISKSFGIATVCAALNSSAIIKMLTSSEPKKIFIIDDFLATSAASSLWSAVVPTVVTGVAGFLAWRQIDYWLHAEERSRFTIMEHEFHAEFAAIKKNVAKELSKRDHDIVARHKAIYMYVDKNIRTLETDLKNQIDKLAHHCDTQQSLIEKMIQEMSNENEEKNKETIKLIKESQASIAKARSEMANIHTTLENLKANNSKMQAECSKMLPIMESINQTTQNIVKNHNIPDSLGLPLARSDFSAESLSNIKIPKDSDDENDDIIELKSSSPAQQGSTAFAQIEALSKTSDSIFKKPNKKDTKPTMTSPKAVQANPEQKCKPRQKTFLGLFDHLIPDKKS